MTTKAKRFPTFPRLIPQLGTEDVVAYGVRVLRFVLEHRMTAGVDDRSLELALHASQSIVTSPDMLEPVREQLRWARYEILATFERRKAMDAEQARKTAATTPPPDGDGGRLVKRPTPPKTNPPGSLAVDLFAEAEALEIEGRQR